MYARLSLLTNPTSIVNLALGILGILVILTSPPSFAAETAPTPAEQTRFLQNVARSILQFTSTNKLAYTRLATLCDTFGPRITGSTNLANATDWTLQQLRQDGFTNVRAEPVTVPHWERGEETLTMISPRPHKMKVLGVGGTPPTPASGIQAEVLVVTDFAELASKSAQARGKIVLFDLPFTDYGSTVAIRTRGAAEAAKAGAVASLIRSVGPFSMQTPHTGMMQADSKVPSIPHAAITLEDAAMLRRMQERGESIQLRLHLSSTQHPDAISHNIIAEYPGHTAPDEIVVIGGHIDSWDVGQGAVDDAGGCIASWEAIRCIKELKLQPRRTLRLVLWTGEENGLWGAKAYRKTHAAELPKHALAIETDRGVFKPDGFAFTGSGKALEWIKAISSHLQPINAGKITLGNGGMDVMELLQDGVPVMDQTVDRTRYFWYHHSEADTVDKIDPADLNQCIAALAIMAYGVADIPLLLPR